MQGGGGGFDPNATAQMFQNFQAMNPAWANNWNPLMLMQAMQMNMGANGGGMMNPAMMGMAGQGGFGQGGGGAFPAVKSAPPANAPVSSLFPIALIAVLNRVSQTGPAAMRETGSSEGSGSRPARSADRYDDRNEGGAGPQRTSRGRGYQPYARDSNR